MKIWKLFFIFQLFYVVLFYLMVLVAIIIGYGFIQNAPKCLLTITRVIIYPFGIVDKIITDTITKEINHFIIVIISSAIVAVFFTALVIGIKAVVKKL